MNVRFTSVPLSGANLSVLLPLVKDSSACVWDLETGASPNVDAQAYGVDPERGALYPETGQVIVAAALVDGEPNVFAHGGQSEAKAVARLIDLLDAEHAREKRIAGHNIRDFDLPYLLYRANVLGVSIPDWLLTDSFGHHPRSIVDTLRILDCRRQRPRPSLSLSHLDWFWQLPVEQHGKHFGEMWREPHNRQELIEYCVFDLAKTALLLHLFEGTGTAIDANEPPHVPFGVDGLPTLAELTSTAPPRKEPSGSFFSWITAPINGVMESGPGPNGWNSYPHKTEEARLRYVTVSGRRDPLCHRIIGYAVSGQDPVIHPDKEWAVIAEGMTVLQRQSYVVDDATLEFGFAAIRLAAWGGGVKEVPVLSDAAPITMRDGFLQSRGINSLPPPVLCSSIDQAHTRARSYVDWHAVAQARCMQLCFV